MGVKDVENRSRKTSHRGPLAIHVGKTPADRHGPYGSLLGIDMPDNIRVLVERAWHDNPDAGCVIGIVDLVDCVDDHPSQWALGGYWHWVFENPRILTDKMPARGNVGIWEFADLAIGHHAD